ncbi:unnamed protein product [Paramecium pentaurelia]|uniref:START domain-containing protein n=1 Tax=Paramecium pentaurelia TaxID=43138 RepID=A0A8S1VDJ9_9CILI|nr:unnamed protein product [Paramecium pentaurelia]
MGSQCCVQERSMNRASIASKAIQDELEYMKELTFCQQRRQILVYEDKPICYFLSKIELQNDTIATAYSLNERGTANEFDQYQQIQDEIVKEIQDKCDYGITPIDDWIILSDNVNSKSMLKLFIKQIEVDNQTKVNATRCEFIVPGKPQNFIEFMSSFQKQKELDSRIDAFYPIKKNEENKESVIYLSYKPILMTSAREFIYYKKTKQIDTNVWCDVSKSVTDSQYPIRNKVRGEILLSGYLIQPLSNLINNDYIKNRFKNKNFDDYSFVRMYSLCDFKLSIPLYMAKGQVKQEMIKYIDLVYEKLQ